MVPEYRKGSDDMRTIGMRLPAEQGEYWTDGAIEGLVGQTFSMKALNNVEMGDYLVIAANRYDDDLLGEGIWVEYEKVDDESSSD